MKLKEFKHPVIQWDMLDEAALELEAKLDEGDPSEQETMALANGYDERGLNLETDAPPGIHDFLVDCLKKHEAFHGIVVGDDGRFDPHLTAHAIYIAQRELEKDGLNHVFIEDITWKPQEKLFVVGLGS